ncbi:hypothetical protein [Spirosoma linguale]|uniref:Secretion system C-terminal sorting domain-containing protein n=1 Tax=Spirosoma linguale (strain ATCC 33905 / DSM 74 / LMG 10896 / Claus 1) TaxID=504472 RepID=D2QQH2_SPILD|nr:hypothetical protein Slin_4775 [Spirosoma linguale DSM 74]
MKTLIKSFALALSFAVVTSAATFSEAKPIGRPTHVASYQSAMYTSVDGKLNIALDKQTGGAVDILMKGADGKVLFTQRVGKNESKFRTRLNLSELPDGVYQVEITNGVETKSQSITISTQQPEAPSRQIAVK